MNIPAHGLIDAQVLGQLVHLDVVAKRVVEGMNVGIHRSRQQGQSIDFADHRPYVAGDDMRHLDWKVLGRSDRLVIKRYEAETDLACTVVVDGSGSMSFQGDGPCSKYRYASVLAASIAWLISQQNDRIGLHILGSELPLIEPARSDRFQRICAHLAEHTPATAVADGHQAAQMLSGPTSHRGLVVVMSDFLDDLDHWRDAFERLHHRGHSLAALWLLDPAEETLSLDRVAQFMDIEQQTADLQVDPRSLREAYAAQVAQHRQQFARLARERGITLIETTTAAAPHQPLNQLLRQLQA